MAACDRPRRPWLRAASVVLLSSVTVSLQEGGRLRNDGWCGWQRLHATADESLFVRPPFGVLAWDDCAPSSLFYVSRIKLGTIHHRTCPSLALGVGDRDQHIPVVSSPSPRPPSSSAKASQSQSRCLPGQAGIPREYLPEHAWHARSCSHFKAGKPRTCCRPYFPPSRQKAVSTVSRIFRLTGAQLPARTRLEQGRRRGKTRLLGHGIF